MTYYVQNAKQSCGDIPSCTGEKKQTLTKHLKMLKFGGSLWGILDLKGRIDIGGAVGMVWHGCQSVKTIRRTTL